MDLIGFSIGCRHCRETDGKRWQFEYEDGEGQLPLVGRADFGLMRMVEHLTLDLGHVCPFCGSPQLEIFDMDLNGQLVFDFDQLCNQVLAQGLALCTLKASKVAGEPGIQMDVVPPTVPTTFLLLALDEIAARVQERPAYDFASESLGTFYFCVAGGWDANAAQYWLVPQKYTCRGLSQKEVLAVVESVKSNLTAG